MTFQILIRRSRFAPSGHKRQDRKSPDYNASRSDMPAGSVSWRLGQMQRIIEKGISAMANGCRKHSPVFSANKCKQQAARNFIACCLFRFSVVFLLLCAYDAAKHRFAAYSEAKFAFRKAIARRYTLISADPPSNTRCQTEPPDNCPCQ